MVFKAVARVIPLREREERAETKATLTFRDLVEEIQHRKLKIQPVKLEKNQKIIRKLG